MIKWVINTGSIGFDFDTLSNTETEAWNKAWLKRSKYTGPRMYSDEEPFTWQKDMEKAWGKGKFYAVELNISQTEKGAPQEVGMDEPL